MRRSAYLLAGLFVLFAALAVTLPRLAGKPGGGLAAGATAALTFLLLGARSPSSPSSSS